MRHCNIVLTFYYGFPCERLVNIYSVTEKIIEERGAVELGLTAF